MNRREIGSQVVDRFQLVIIDPAVGFQSRIFFNARDLTGLGNCKQLREDSASCSCLRYIVVSILPATIFSCF
jgi:hypothetical protein